ncbi:MAG: hypothetical protein ACPGVT_05390 [Maricaulaceae bacterium]
MVSRVTENLMISWLSEHPYEVYGHRNDEFSDKQIDLIVEGQIERFYEDWFDVECHYRNYADFSDIETAFAKQFHLHSPKSQWPEAIADIFDQNVLLCINDVLETCYRHSNPKIAVKPIKQSGNEIEFPHIHFERDYNRYLNRYNASYLGFENSHKAETCYTYDTLTVIGRIDLKHWLEQGRAPDFIQFGPEDMLLTHNSYNGSGGLGEISITKTRKMRANFRHDKTDRHGVDRVFMFVREAWDNDLNCIWA